MSKPIRRHRINYRKYRGQYLREKLQDVWVYRPADDMLQAWSQKTKDESNSSIKGLFDLIDYKEEYENEKQEERSLLSILLRRLKMKVNQTKRKNKVKWFYHSYYRSSGFYNFWGVTWIDSEAWTWNMPCFRAIKTYPERRAACLTEEEKEYGVRVRGRRQGHALPDAYDDICISAWSTQKSWKHNSKRRKQWKYE